MRIEESKTKAMVFSPPHIDQPTADSLEVNNKNIDIIPEVKLVGITLDEKLNFQSHICNTQTKAYKALKAISKVTNAKKNPNQEAHLQLYRAMIRPILEYGTECTLRAGQKHDAAYAPIQRKALLAATGCKIRTSTDALEVLTGIMPIDIHLTCRQAQAYLRMATKHTGNPIYDKIAQERSEEKIGTTLHLLETRFKEMKGEIEVSTVDKECYYDSRLPPFSVGRITGSFLPTTTNPANKEEAKEKVKQILHEMKKTPTTVVFTDGSSLGNPGPTGCAAVIYEQWGVTEPYTVRKPVAAKSNNYEGELQGIYLALNTLHRSQSKNRRILILCDCKAALENVSSLQQAEAYNDLVNAARQRLFEIQQKGHNIQIEWCPGHMGVEGNELADMQAKLAAEEAKHTENNTTWTKQQAMKHIEEQAVKRWQRRRENQTTSSHMQKANTSLKKKCSTWESRTTQISINQLVSGHTELNAYKNWIDPTETPNCGTCGTRENIDHYMYECPKYENTRQHLMKEIDNIYEDYGIPQQERTMDVVSLAGMRSDLTNEANKRMYLAFTKYIEDTRRFAEQV
ncbi:uncharacterized protein LOC118422282 [Branchiostoma floridae]|uniref:Uncharacterized protein LOC118422282 n=1 Tax=Branchiostoma floridae TaxID=7739 RepID=A0A9J7LPP1_BRAFL|nr:uncharacterized protein LOC118422282 [Branchiostoma floridae]